MREPARPVEQPLSAAEFDELDRALAAWPPPAQPLDVVALDGHLCGVLLQPVPVPESQWLPGVLDVETGSIAAAPGPGWPAGESAARVATLVRRRHAELDAAIGARRWFDPWVFELDDAQLPPHAATLPWVAGFAAAMERFPKLMAQDEAQLLEPLAVLYAAFDPEDLEDAQALLEEIETLEPPATLEEAVEDLVTSVLRLADVARPGRAAVLRPPQRQPRPPRRPRQRPRT
jgi:uncharacterized protein